MDIVIVGSGISGMSAAVTAALEGNHVELLSPYPSERSQSVMAAGGINAVNFDSVEEDSIALHVQDTYRGGSCIERQEDIEALCSRAPEHLEFLENLGVAFSRNKDNTVCRRAFGGQSRRRTAYAGSSTGKQIVTALVQKCRELEKKGDIVRHTGLYFYSVLHVNGVCHGILAMERSSNKIQPFYADAVIMATGGQNKLFGKTTGTELCDGYAAGKLFSQGVTLRNLEFIQYHPTTIETSHKRMLITEAARGEGGRLYYIANGKRIYFMEDMFGEKGNLMPRDITSKCIYDCPSQVYLDITFLGKKLIFERLREVYDLCMEYLHLDVTKESIPVSPSVHFFMGGIAVDGEHETNFQRLYAVGECASKYHGANRLGGNSLLAAVHSGRVAAESCSKKYTAFTESDRQDAAGIFENEIAAAEAVLSEAKESKSLYPAVYILKDLEEIMNRNLGITRSEEGLVSGITQISYYLDILSHLKLDPAVSVYESIRLYPMLLLAKAVLVSAESRKETRGAHIRLDYPDSSEEFRKCSFVSFKDGAIRIWYE